MADSSVEITAGVGTLVSSRTNASGEQMQVVMLGLDGSAGFMQGQKQAVDSLPVVLASDQDFIHAEDAAHASGHKGVMLLAIRETFPPSSSATTDGDYTAIKGSPGGRVYTQAKLDIERTHDQVFLTNEGGLVPFAMRRDVPTALATGADKLAPLITDNKGQLWTKRAVEDEADGHFTVTLFDNRSGTGTAETDVVEGYNMAMMEVKISATATIIPYLTSGFLMGTALPTPFAYNVATGEMVKLITKSGWYRLNLAGANTLGVSISANSGTVTVKARIMAAGAQSPEAGFSGRQLTLFDTTIRDTTAVNMSLIGTGLITEEEIRRYHRFKFYFYSTHNTSAAVAAYTANVAEGLFAANTDNVLYTEAAILLANVGRLIFQSSPNTGAFASESVKSVPAFDDVHSNIIFVVQHGTAPTTGTLKVIADMQM